MGFTFVLEIIAFSPEKMFLDQVDFYYYTVMEICIG